MTDHPLPVVGVKLAFSWECPTCSQKNYADAVFHEFDAEEKAEVREETGEDPVTGEWVAQPEVVSCPNCGTACETKNSGQHAPV